MLSPLDIDRLRGLLPPDVLLHGSGDVRYLFAPFSNGEIYVLVYRPSQRQRLIKALALWAANDDLSIGWDDVRRCLAKAREEART